MPVLSRQYFSGTDLDSDNPVRCALVGAGDFGSCLLGQALLLGRRLTVPVICDTDVPKTRALLREELGVDDASLVVCGSAAEASAALVAGKSALVSDRAHLRGLDVDIVVVATGLPVVDAAVAAEAIAEGKHVCMVSKEAESVAGPMLARLAAEAGVVCTLVDGDQPSLLIGLLDWCDLLGLEVVCAGKSGEGDYTVNPTAETIRVGSGSAVSCPGIADLWDIAEGDDAAHVVAERSRLISAALGRSAPRRTEADLGEMGVITNHTGLLPDTPSLHLPLCRSIEVPRLFCPMEDGGLLSSKCVDVFAQLHLEGELRFAGGVFVVVRGSPDSVWQSLARKGMPSYIAPSGTTYMMLYNPQHLLGVEAPLSILSAVRLGKSTGGARPVPRSDLVAVADRDLVAGEVLALGAGHGVGCLEPRLAPPQRSTVQGSDGKGYVPYYLAAGHVMARDVVKGDALVLDDVMVPRDTTLFKLRQQQEAIVWEDKDEEEDEADQLVLAAEAARL